MHTRGTYGWLPFFRATILPAHMGVPCNCSVAYCIIVLFCCTRVKLEFNRCLPSFAPLPSPFTHLRFPRRSRENRIRLRWSERFLSRKYITCLRSTICALPAIFCQKYLSRLHWSHRATEGAAPSPRTYLMGHILQCLVVPRHTYPHPALSAINQSPKGYSTVTALLAPGSFSDG